MKTKLTDDEINRKIAEAVGWRDIYRGARNGSRALQGVTLWGIGPNDSSKGGEQTFSILPRYTDSLDACAGFEKTLTDEQCVRFQNALEDVWAGSESGDCAASYFFFHATARQRCEAFLRVIGGES